MVHKGAVVLAFIFMVNLVAADMYLFRLWNNRPVISQPIKSDECGEECQKTVKALVDEKISRLPTAGLKGEEVRVTAGLKTAVKTRNIQYIPIPGNGSTMENKWVDLAGTEFYISTQDYPGLVGAYFESNMRLVNGNGSAFVRLWDVTAGIEVWGSEIEAKNQNFTSVSTGKMTLREGTHLYRVQAKSLTADTTVFNSGRVKMITED